MSVSSMNIEQILTDIWHNQATMIKWHTQEVEALKNIVKILKKMTKNTENK